MILCTIFFTKNITFPGWYVVVPVLGTMTLIGAGPNACVNKIILSNSLLVWFGLVSFPLYLWHWPLLSFARIYLGQTPDRIDRI